MIVDVHVVEQSDFHQLRDTWFSVARKTMQRKRANTTYATVSQRGMWQLRVFTTAPMLSKAW